MRLILFFLKCILGLLASIGLLTLLVGLGLGLGWREIKEWRMAAPEVPEQAILTLDLRKGVVERKPDNPLALASGESGAALHETVAALALASQDERVEALVVHLGRGSIGMAQVQELRSAVLAFRESGKPAIAFAETFGEGGSGTLDSYLAGAFEEVWMQPSGEVGMTGFLLETPFMEEALDSLGIEARLDQRGEYKGVADPFRGNSLPEPQRENLQRLLDSWTGQIATDIALARALEPQAVRALIDEAPLTAERALAVGLVHRLGYLGDLETRLDEDFGGGAMLGLADYRERVAQEETSEDREAADPPARIAVIHAQGAVSLTESENDPFFGRLVMGSDTVAPAILAAAEEEEVAAIVLRIDSPGGSYVASDAIWAAVREARTSGKPVVASFGNVAASGGYFVAMGADAIVAQPGTITGSIGVASGKLVLAGLWERLGVTFDGVQSGERAGLWSSNRDFDDEGWDLLQDSLDRTYADFTAKLAEGRGLNPAEIEAVAQGRIWSGADAHDRGLVDALGGLHEALRLAANLAEVPENRPVEALPYPKPRDPFEELLSNILAGRIESPAVAAAVRPLARILEAWLPATVLYQRLTGGLAPENRALESGILAPGT